MYSPIRGSKFLCSLCRGIVSSAHWMMYFLCVYPLCPPVRAGQFVCSLRIMCGAESGVFNALVHFTMECSGRYKPSRQSSAIIVCRRCVVVPVLKDTGHSHCMGYASTACIIRKAIRKAKRSVVVVLATFHFIQLLEINQFLGARNVSSKKR